MDIFGNQFKEEIRALIREEMASATPPIAETPQETGPPVILNQKKLCQAIGLSEPTVIRWRKKGKIPFMQAGSAIRYDLNVVLEALEVKKKGLKYA